MRLNPNLYVEPVFTEPSGVGLRGRDISDLLRVVAEYRARNGFPPGDPVAEITVQICAKAPDRCMGRGKTPRKGTVARGGLHLRILNWMAGVINSVIPKGSTDKALERAKICAVCPQQKAWEGNCSSCDNSVRKLRPEILKGVAENKSYRQLKGCAILGEDTRTSIWIDQPVATDPEMPAHCWRRANACCGQGPNHAANCNYATGN